MRKSKIAVLKWAHNQNVRNFCITVNDFGEVHYCNAHWLKVTL